MANMVDGYPFVFVMKDNDGADEVLECTLQYRFKSEKSHHTYIVRVEKYIKHVYCLKFFDKANINSKNKYSIRQVPLSRGRFFIHYTRFSLTCWAKTRRLHSFSLERKTSVTSLVSQQGVTGFTVSSCHR